MKHLLPWKLWSKEKPTVPGFYWLAFYENEDGFESMRPEEPLIWEVDDFYMEEDRIEYVKNWPLENIIWLGPLEPPAFSGKKK